jgi:long-chain acyl-CoA synthetase
MTSLIEPTGAVGDVDTEPQTLGQLVLDVAERHSGVALQYPRDGRMAYISYSELGNISSEIARGLISLGIEPGDRVAILGLTSPDWTLADCERPSPRCRRR